MLDKFVLNKDRPRVVSKCGDLLRLPLFLSLAIVAGVIAFPRHIPGQTPDTSPTPTPMVQPTREILAEVDPTQPILFSFRNEYKDLKNGNWADALVFRYDRFALRNLKIKGGGKGFVLRFDVPVNTVHRGTVTKAGLGDIYTQVLFVPYATRKFAFTAGSGFSMSTATDAMLGTGKLLVAPVAVPIWYLAKRKRLILLRIQNFTSVAGKSNRAKINYFNLEPTFAWALDKQSWVLFNNEFKWDWRSKRGSGVAGVQFGRMIHGKTGIWFKPEIPWGPGRSGGFNVKVGVFRFR